MEFSVDISEPLCNIFNSATIKGIWPKHWKHEVVTPVPKVYPPKSPDDLRKIACTKNLSKVYEALLSETIIKDISPNIDKAQYGNKKGLSTTHYLVNMINRILTIVDSNSNSEKYAVVAQLIDWSKAFDRQDATLGIQSFIKCGVRSSVIPILMSFFQGRTMTVKWNGCMSSSRDLPGGSPQGSTFGLLQYDVNSDSNARHIPQNLKFKFVDDLSTLELINLLMIGLSSYNIINHVASDISVGQKFIPKENLVSQQYLNQIENWTLENKAKLNVEKTKVMIFNFCEDYQFRTRLYVENTLLETIQETKLLGTIVTSDLTWHSNTNMLVRKSFMRMQILHKLSSFSVSQNDLKEIYILYIRSILEQNCQVWHFSLSEEDKISLERVQKVAFKVILKSRYIDYENALKVMQLKTLEERRSYLCLKFAKKCIKHPVANEMFPLNPPSEHYTRRHEKFKVQKARTSRLRDSSIPQMQRLLNADVINT